MEPVWNAIMNFKQDQRNAPKKCLKWSRTRTSNEDTRKTTLKLFLFLFQNRNRQTSQSKNSGRCSCNKHSLSTVGSATVDVQRIGGESRRTRADTPHHSRRHTHTHKTHGEGVGEERETLLHVEMWVLFTQTHEKKSWDLKRARAPQSCCALR